MPKNRAERVVFRVHSLESGSGWESGLEWQGRLFLVVLRGLWFRLLVYLRCGGYFYR